ncbi:MAG: hypothetical protein ACLTDV_01690 [Eubacterium sp.]
MMRTNRIVTSPETASASLAMSWSAMGVDTEEARNNATNFRAYLISTMHWIQKSTVYHPGSQASCRAGWFIKIVLADGSRPICGFPPGKDGKNAIPVSFWNGFRDVYPLRRLTTRRFSLTVDANTGVIVDGKEISQKQKNPSRGYDELHW